MKILVDTSVWSEGLRRKKKSINSSEVFISKLITNDELIVLTGIILQEILSGIKDEKLFCEIRDILSGFEIIEPNVDDYIYAAELRNKLQKKGVSATTVDVLIASLAIRKNFYLATYDNDFVNISKIDKKLKLLDPEKYSRISKK